MIKKKVIPATKSCVGKRDMSQVVTHALFGIYAGNFRSNRAAGEGYWQRTCITASRQGDEMPYYTGSYIDSVVHLIISWIELNISKPIKVKDVVARSGYSEFHLQRSFRACTGESIAHYVRRRKLENAADILRNTDLAIIDLAFNMGFDDVSTFYRSFRREFGVAPGKYRERHKAGHYMGVM